MIAYKGLIICRQAPDVHAKGFDDTLMRFDDTLMRFDDTLMRFDDTLMKFDGTHTGSYFFQYYVMLEPATSVMLQ